MSPADDLVHRVVAADVLAEAEQLAALVDEAGRVEPAGRGERRLGGAQSFGKRGDELGREHELAVHGRSLHRHRLEGALPANPARGRGVEVAAQAARSVSSTSASTALAARSAGGAAAIGWNPSESRNPSASSSSWPGVRIVTATGSPPTRISSGSSTATSSGSSTPPGRRSDRDRLRRVRRRRSSQRRSPLAAWLSAASRSPSRKA